jgi:uncharacterized repeat protein (TIGR03803 family)
MIATQATQAQTYKVIHNFTGGADGATPWAGLTMDQAGNFYGTSEPDYLGAGTVFKLSEGESGWVLNPLYNFTGGSDGALPTSGLIMDQAGNLYGTTAYGGIGSNGGYGTVFSVKSPGTPCSTALCRSRKTVLYTFTGGTDGVTPNEYGGNLVFDKAGNIYGTTTNGGLLECESGSLGCGTVFQLSPSGSGWTESVLYRFTGGSDGAWPTSALILDQAGNLYGTAIIGGVQGGCQFVDYYGCGVVFKLSPSESGWTESVLYSFTGGADGGLPVGGLIFGPSGNLYGTTEYGGDGGGGTVFQLTPSNGTWTLETIYSFNGDEGELDNLAIDEAGDLYGTTGADGAYGNGNVFELQPSDGGWTYTSLHDFCAIYPCNDGAVPVGSVIFDQHGNLYGTTYGGGSAGLGVVWEITR